MYDPAQDMWPFDRVSGLREWGDDASHTGPRLHPEDWELH